MVEAMQATSVAKQGNKKSEVAGAQASATGKKNVLVLKIVYARSL